MAAIIASLIFVGVQLRQDQMIARSEMTSRSFELLIALEQNLFSRDLASTYAKMLDQSEKLSIEESVQIDSLLATLVIIYERECILKARTIFVECEAIVQLTVEKYFGNWYAQSWWKANKAKHLGSGDYGSVPSWIDDKIEAVDPNAYRQMIDKTLSHD